MVANENVYVGATTYPVGTAFAFDVLKSKVNGILSFNSDSTLDLDHFPELPQPILVRVQAPPPYGMPLTGERDENYDFAYGMIGAAKVAVLQKPSPGMVYGNNLPNVIFWNWPDQTPPAFSALVARCNPLLLPDKVVRYGSVRFEGYLRDTEQDVTFLGSVSNYLSLLGPCHEIDERPPACQAYGSPMGGPIQIGSDYITVPPSCLEAVQYLDIGGTGLYSGELIGEAAHDLGFWVAFLPIHYDHDDSSDLAWLLEQAFLF